MLKKFLNKVVCLAVAALTALSAMNVFADNKAEILTSLGVGISEKANEDLVTRAEFAKMIVALSGMGDLSDAESFSDVPDEYKAACSIACKFGYMNYFEDMTFHPDEYITLEECAKATVVMLGHKELAKYMGGYINAAKKLKLFKFSEADYKRNIKYGELITLFYNALFTETGTLGAANSGSRTLFDVVYNGNIYEGKITSTAYCSFKGNETGDKERVCINGVVYKTAVDVSEFFGYYVEFVMREINGEDTITFVIPKSERNTTLEIEYDDIINYSGRQYSYYKNNQKRTANLSDTAAFILNGGTASNADRETMMPKDGKISLLDSDGDSLYDVVFITAPELKEVSSVNASKKSVYCSDGTSYETENYDEVVFEGGELGKMNKGTVINVFKNFDAGIIKIVTLTDAVSGKLSAAGQKSGRECFWIDDTQYEKAADMIYETAPEIGQDVNVILDYAGRIGKISVLSSKNIGYIISAGKESGIDEKVRVKILDSEGNCVLVPVAKKLTLNDAVYGTPNDIMNALKFGESKAKRQLIQYEINKDGELKKIITAYNNNANYKEELKNKPAEDSLRMIHACSFSSDSEALEYRSVQRTFGLTQVFAARSNTKVFVVPKGDSTNDDDYKLYTLDFFTSEKTYKVDAYSYSKGDYIADVIIYYEENAAAGTRPNMTSSRRYAYVEGIGSTMLDDGTVGDMLQLRMSGEIGTVDVVINDDVDITKVYAYDGTDENLYSLDKGDIIMYETDTKGRMKSVMIIIDWSEKTPELQYKGGAGACGINSMISSWPRFQYADLYQLVDGYGILCFKDLKDSSYTFDASDARPENLEYAVTSMVVIDTESGDVYTSKPDNIHTNSSDLKDFVNYGKECSRVLVITKWGYKEDLFIFN